MLNTPDEAIAYLMGRVNYERQLPSTRRPAEFKLQSVRELAHRLGDPHLAAPVVHVAGTKGKGSTATMLATIAKAAGIRCGLYTSPHLHRLEERFLVDLQPIDAQGLVAAVCEVKTEADRLLNDIESGKFDGAPPTFFDLVTLTAWVHFRNTECDLTVIEVGLGGRLDSTNICQPLLGVITSISRDHTAILGDTLAEIAGEKAGIIKPNIEVLHGVQDDSAKQVIEQACKSNGCAIWRLDRDFAVQPHIEGPMDVEQNVECEPAISYQTESTWDFVPLQLERQVPIEYSKQHSFLHELCGIELNLAGAHQQRNAALAIAAAQRLTSYGFEIDDRALLTGLQDVALPGRIEWLRKSPQIVADVAHNQAAVTALVKTLSCHQYPDGRRIAIVSVSDDKDHEAIIDELLKFFDQIVFTSFQTNPRARSARELAQLTEKRQGEPGDHGISSRQVDVVAIDDPQEALNEVLPGLKEHDQLVVTGSTFLVAELRPSIESYAVGISEASLSMRES